MVFRYFLAIISNSSVKICRNFFMNSSGFPTKLPRTSTKISLVFKIFPTTVLKTLENYITVASLFSKTSPESVFFFKVFLHCFKYA